MAIISNLGPWSNPSLNPSDTLPPQAHAIGMSSATIRFSPADSTLEAFLAAAQPSRISKTQAAWIHIDNPHQPPPPPPASDDAMDTSDDVPNTPDESGLAYTWRELCATRQPTTTDLDELAQHFRVRAGKWLVFADTAHIDELWARIAHATFAGALGDAAKVSPCEVGSEAAVGPSHVICVYTRDYTDEGEVRRVRRALRTLGVKRRIGYKPDVYTLCGVYGRNAWGISPTRYHY